MDLVIDDYFAVDITVSNHYEKRLTEKVKKYGEAVKVSKMQLHVLCFSPSGAIHEKCLPFAKRMAKSAGMTFNDFWAPAVAEVIRGTTQSVLDATRFVKCIADINRQNAAETAMTAATPETIPAPLSTLPTAQDVSTTAVASSPPAATPSSKKPSVASKPATTTSLPSTTTFSAQGVIASATPETASEAKPKEE